MSSPRRHGLPKKKPGRPAKDEIAAELPELEPIEDDTLPLLEPIEDEELPELEPIDEGPVKVVCAVAGENGFDQALTVDVPAMDKKDVPDAVRGPLQRAAERAAAVLRHQRVLVRFSGEAMIGSAMKEVVAELLKPHKPQKLVLRRGFGDELLFEGKAPQVEVQTHVEGDVVKVTVATGDLEAIDLPIVLPAELVKLAAGAKGRKFTFAFRGGVKPDAATRDLIAAALQQAGAVRAAVGERVLFDCELADRVKISADGAGMVVHVTPAADSLITREALQMVLPGVVAQFAGKVVRIHLVSAAPDGDVELCVRLVEKGKPQRIEIGAGRIGDGGAEAEVVWPALVEVVAGAETTLRLQANGRGRASVLAAFRREAAALAGAVKGRSIVVDWPAGFAVDAEAEACMVEALGTANPKSVACTIAGESREPFVPAPVSLRSEGGVSLLRLDVDAGKPAELLRAIERRLPSLAETLRGQPVRVQVAGAAAPSRTLLRTVCGSVEAAGATRLELDDHGVIDVLLPPMLAITKATTGTRIGAVVGGRDAAQQVLAMQRELDAAELPKEGSYTLSQSSVTEALVAALIARGAGRIRLDGNVPVQVHPPLFAAPERKLDRLMLRAAPDADDAVVGKQIERELPALLSLQKDLAKITAVVVWPGAMEPVQGPLAAVVQGLVDQKVGKVFVDGGSGKQMQVHPPVVVTPPVPAAPAAASPSLLSAAAAAPIPAVAAGSSLLSILARKDEAVPPMLMLGVAAGVDEAHLGAVRQQIEAHLPRFRGRCVMLVIRAADADVPVRRSDALISLLTQIVPTAAAATLVFRGPDAQGRPHFQVVHSTLRALPIGSAFGDPRLPR
jgi:hypothetical protein